jgi:hypothetical protein
MSPSDLVLKVSLNLHEQSSADEERFDRMAIRTFDIDLFVPSALHDARNTEGVLAIALDDLHPKRCSWRADSQYLDTPELSHMRNAAAGPLTGLDCSATKLGEVCEHIFRFRL